MPIVKIGRDGFDFCYKLPKRKKNLMTKEFLQTFKQELDNVFNEESYLPIEQRSYWNTYQLLESTGGFYEALESTCKQHNLIKAIYEYSYKMPWYDSDLFDSELTLLMVERGVIEEGNTEEVYDDFDYENDEDFELKIVKKKLKDCTIIHKDWALTQECKDRLGIK